MQSVMNFRALGSRCDCLFIMDMDTEVSSLLCFVLFTWTGFHCCVKTGNLFVLFCFVAFIRSYTTCVPCLVVDISCVVTSG